MVAMQDFQSHQLIPNPASVFFEPLLFDLILPFSPIRNSDLIKKKFNLTSKHLNSDQKATHSYWWPEVSTN